MPTTAATQPVESAIPHLVVTLPKHWPAQADMLSWCQTMTPGTAADGQAERFAWFQRHAMQDDPRVRPGGRREPVVQATGRHCPLAAVGVADDADALAIHLRQVRQGQRASFYCPSCQR